MADAMAAPPRSGRAGVTIQRNPGRDDCLIMALPNGRILGEVMPLLRQIGIEPEAAFDDPASRQLRFTTSEPRLDLIRVRSFDAATFVAFGAAHLGVAGNDVDTYLTADLMTNADWINLTSVTVTLTFSNPLWCAAGACLQGQSTSQPATISFTRVVDIMNRTGET